MTNNDIIRMAREAGFNVDNDGKLWIGYANGFFLSGETSATLTDGLKELARIAYREGAAAEREACARLFDMPEYLNGEQEDWFREVAATIRARNE